MTVSPLELMIYSQKNKSFNITLENRSKKKSNKKDLVVQKEAALLIMHFLF